MKRTTTRRRRAMTDFLAGNRRLFPFVGLFLLGAAIGVIAYMTVAPHITRDWGSLLRVSGVTGGLKNGLGALSGAVFSELLLLAALFLLGLWPCGAPFVLLAPLLQGIGLGLTEAYYYSLGRTGVAAVAAVILPHGLLCAAVLTMAGAESLRLSLQLSRQLLPAEPAALADAAPGALWPRFRLYCLRFLLFLALALATGLVNVLLRTVFAGLLP